MIFSLIITAMLSIVMIMMNLCIIMRIVLLINIWWKASWTTLSAWKSSALITLLSSKTFKFKIILLMMITFCCCSLFNMLTLSSTYVLYFSSSLSMQSYALLIIHAFYINFIYIFLKRFCCSSMKSLMIFWKIMSWKRINFCWTSLTLLRNHFMLYSRMSWSFTRIWSEVSWYHLFNKSIMIDLSQLLNSIRVIILLININKFKSWSICIMNCIEYAKRKSRIWISSVKKVNCMLSKESEFNKDDLLIIKKRLKAANKPFMMNWSCNAISIMKVASSITLRMIVKNVSTLSISSLWNNWKSFQKINAVSNMIKNV